jgi:hypothetical protein
MKIYAIFLACPLWAHGVIVEGASCRPLEYAEIQDTETTELVTTYCYYGAVWKIHNDASARQNRLFLEQIRTTQSTESLESLQSAYQRNDALESEHQRGCSDQREKIVTALKARGARVDLSCNPPPSARPKP